MKLVSMKRASDEDCSCMEHTSPNYGYGLSLSLNEDQCEALGLTKIRAGSKVTLQAVAIVTSTNESVSREPGESGTELSITVQITELGLQQQGATKNAAAILYGDDD
jgi:hypothetical protein